MARFLRAIASFEAGFRNYGVYQAFAVLVDAEDPAALLSAAPPEMQAAILEDARRLHSAGAPVLDRYGVVGDTTELLGLLLVQGQDDGVDSGA